MTTERVRPRSCGGRARHLLVVVAVAVIGAVACGKGGDATGPGSTSEERKADVTPAFAADTTAGTTFAHPTGKPTVLFFMAGWCTDCLPEATALDAIERDLGDKVAILAIDADPTDPIESLRNFERTVGARYGYAHDPEGRLTGKFGVRSLDTTIITDAAGRVVFRDGVTTDEGTLREALDRAGAR